MDDPDKGFDAELQSNGVTFDREDAALLRAIEREESLAGAAAALGRSRARAGTRVDELEAAFGPLVERRRGGADGGGTRLTSEAQDLLARFNRLRTAFQGVAEATETVFVGRIRERDGELATVATGAGEVRALTPPDADCVEVSLQADAVTLQDPADVPDADATSARNRIFGRVSRLDRGEAVVRVHVEVGADAPLVALVTAESAEQLGLEVGNNVVATFKATATRATTR